MLISVVVLSFNSEETLSRCLSELENALSGFNEECEVFVIENGSKDGSVKIIESHQQDNAELIKPILLDRNTGTTYSRNLALVRASGDYIMVLDSDAYVNFDAISSLIEHLSSNREVGMAVPRLFYRSGRFQLSCDVFPTLIHKLRRFIALKSIEANESVFKNADEPILVDYAISACWMLRRDACQATGLFDEKIFYSPEDVDYCLRLWDAGYKIMYVPAAEVIHDAQELSRGFKLSFFHASHLRGLFYLFRKHRYFLGRSRLYRRIGRHRG